MIKRKILELENIGLLSDDSWQRTDAVVTLNDDTENNENAPELNISVGNITIAIPVQDLLDCLEELGVDVKEWVS